MKQSSIHHFIAFQFSLSSDLWQTALILFRVLLLGCKPMHRITEYRLLHLGSTHFASSKIVPPKKKKKTIKIQCPSTLDSVTCVRIEERNKSKKVKIWTKHIPHSQQQTAFQLGALQFSNLSHHDILTWQFPSIIMNIDILLLLKLKDMPEILQLL